ncbi:MAG: KOW motif-containing protein [Nanoarchaeota archaeon]
MYLKRAKTPTTWPIARKGTKYVIVPTHNIEKGVSLMLMLRDHLELGNTRREVRKATLSGNVLVNGKEVKDVKYGLALNDVITLKAAGENYRLTYSETKKFVLEKISAGEAVEKVSKIVGKKILKGNIIQISLLDGRTMIVKTDAKIGSSALIDLKTNTIKKVIPMEKGAEVIVIAGKHLGKKGKIEEIKDEVARITFSHGKKIGLKVNNLMVQK